MTHDIPLRTRWDMSSNAEEHVFEICEGWLRCPGRSKLSYSEEKYIGQLRKADKSQIAQQANTMLKNSKLSDFENVRDQILYMLLLWEWAIRAKKRYDNAINPAQDKELEERIGAKHLLACVHIIKARAIIAHEPRKMPLTRDSRLFTGQDSIDDSEDESPEPLEGWKRFSKPVDMIASVVGSSRKVVHNRPPKRKNYSEDDSDASENTREKKPRNINKKIKKEDHSSDDSDTLEHSREKKSQNINRKINKEDLVNEKKRKANDDTSDNDSKKRKKDDSAHEKKRKANDDISLHDSTKKKRKVGRL